MSDGAMRPKKLHFWYVSLLLHDTKPAGSLDNRICTMLILFVCKLRSHISCLNVCDYDIIVYHMTVLFWKLQKTVIQLSQQLV